MMRLDSRAIVAASAVVVAFLAPPPAFAKNIAVSSAGADSATCGTGSAVPCATLAQAVINAVDGDSISVAAGVYAGTTVAKSVSLTSSSGGSGAVITGGLTLAANGIELGKRGKGFSVSGGPVTIAGDDVVVRGNAFSDAAICIWDTTGGAAVIRDNSFDSCGIGVQVSAAGAQIRGNRFGYSSSMAVSLQPSSSAAVVRENRMFGPTGFAVMIDGSDHLLLRNFAHGTPGGIVSSGAPTGVSLVENVVVSAGAPAFLMSGGSGWILDGNAAMNSSGPGFYLTAGTPFVATDNVAIGCGAYGFLVGGGSDHVLQGNSAIQNVSDGIVLSSVGSGVTITGGNVYGNGDGNCGLTNASPGAVTTSDIYWGAASGPGADPADGICSNIAGVVVNSPAAEPARVRMPPIK